MLKTDLVVYSHITILYYFSLNHPRKPGASTRRRTGRKLGARKMRKRRGEGKGKKRGKGKPGQASLQRALHDQLIFWSIISLILNFIKNEANEKRSHADFGSRYELSNNISECLGHTRCNTFKTKEFDIPRSVHVKMTFISPHYSMVVFSLHDWVLRARSLHCIGIVSWFGFRAETRYIFIN